MREQLHRRCVILSFTRRLPHGFCRLRPVFMYMRPTIGVPVTFFLSSNMPTAAHVTMASAMSLRAPTIREELGATRAKFQRISR